MAERGDFGSFLATTQVWDVGEIYSAEGISPDLKELLVRLYQNLNNQSLSVNTRDAGYYDTSEFVNGQLYFPNPALDSSSTTTPTQRQVFRKVLNCGALAAGAPWTTTVAHGITITPAMTFTRIYGATSNPTGSVYLPIPHADTTAAANNISVSVGAANVTITVGVDRHLFDTTYVVLEYLKF